jgi:hypothetical protein
VARRFDLLVRVNQQGAEKLQVEISDEELKGLTGYLEDFDRLAATNMGGESNITIKYTFDVEKGFAWRVDNLPPEDDIAAFLLRLRPFILAKESSNFYRVCKILGRAIRHAGMAALLRQQRDEFSGRAFQSQIELFSNQTMVNTEVVLQNWLNAYEYHRDPERREELSKVHHERLPLEAIRPVSCQC